jgi:hypothetical protein
VPWIDSSDIFGMFLYPKQSGFEKVQLIWNSEKNGLPENKQVGTTCGIYALHAAANVLGKHYATPAGKQGVHLTSIRAEAKKGLSKIGEINGADDMQKLAARLGIATIF